MPDLPKQDTPKCTASAAGESSTQSTPSSNSPVQRMRTRNQSTSSRPSSPTSCPSPKLPKLSDTTKKLRSPPPDQDQKRSQSDRLGISDSLESVTVSIGDTHMPTEPANRSHPIDTLGTSTVPDDFSQALLALLEPTYPKELIDWFDRLSSEEPHVSESTIPHETTLNAKLASVQSKPKADHCSVSLSVAPNPIPTPSVIPSNLVTAYADFLLGAVTSLPEELLKSMLAATEEVACEVCWVGYVQALQTSRTDEVRSLLAAKFISVCCAVSQAKNHIECSTRLKEYLFSSLAELSRSQDLLYHAIRAMFCLFSKLSDDSIQVSRLFFVQLVRCLFLNCNTSQALHHLPVILDASIQGFQQMWHSTEPLRDVAASQFYTPITNPSNYSYWVATLQALIAWQESHFDLVKNPDTPEFRQYDLLLTRLHALEWLPGPRSPPTRSDSKVCPISQHTHRVRLLALRLVDACLCVTRQKSLDVQLQIHPAYLLANQTTEAACSLTILLSAMMFVVGDEAVIEDVPITEQQNLSSRGATHQRKRRHRQTQRQQRYGLLGWLLTSRLLPWLCNCFKSLDTLVRKNNGVPQTSALVVDRLAVLITDIIILGSYLFYRLKNTPATHLTELRKVLFDSGRRLIETISTSSAQSHMSVEARRVCLTRLFAFEPSQVLQLVMDTKDATVALDRSVVAPTILWPDFSLHDLYSQALLLAEQTVPRLPTSLVQQYREFCNAECVTTS
ncbi:unnamed protein product [Echinostoma caproni]|uniref:Uncharacterized protein n=1 Tax=Echinostoma caproni TaxID=27848 RepID=A0A3P8GRB7_9TREM|nr:unnamed protein product [Echinostoma caproni]